MARKSYTNQIEPTDVSLAIEALLIADYPGSFTPARIDLDALPSGYCDLGAVVEDTPKISVNRTKFQLDAGLPMIRQFEAVTKMEGNFEATLHSNSWRKVQFAFGNYTAASSATQAGSISSVFSTGLTFVLSTTPTTALAIGQQIIITSPGNFDKADATEVRIASINSDNRTITIRAETRKAFVAGCVVGVYSRVQQVIGTNKIKYYSLLGVADFIDGTQIIHELRKVSPAESWEESFKPDANGRVPLNFNALGFRMTIDSCTQLVIGLRHYFPSLTLEC